MPEPWLILRVGVPSISSEREGQTEERIDGWMVKRQKQNYKAENGYEDLTLTIN